MVTEKIGAKRFPDIFHGFNSGDRLAVGAGRCCRAVSGVVTCASRHHPTRARQWPLAVLLQPGQRAVAAGPIVRELEAVAADKGWKVVGGEASWPGENRPRTSLAALRRRRSVLASAGGCRQKSWTCCGLSCMSVIVARSATAARNGLTYALKAYTKLRCHTLLGATDEPS